MVNTMLPTPALHYEMLRHTPGNPLDILSEEHQTAVLMDPYNTGGTNPIPVQTISAYSTTYNMLRSAIAYKRSGQQVVVLGPRMQEAFAHTSLKEVSSQHLRFPFPCFYLATPGSKLRVWGGTDTGWHAIAGAYVMEDPNEAGMVSILIWGNANEWSKSAGDDATFWFSVKVGELLTEDLDAKMVEGLNDDQLVNGTIANIELEARQFQAYHASRTLNLEDRIDKVLSNPYGNISDRFEPGQKDLIPWSSLDTDGVLVELKTSVRAFLRVVVNTILYMNSSSCETKTSNNDAKRKELEISLGRKKHKTGKDAKKVKRHLDDTPACRFTWIGPTIEEAKGASTDLTGSRSVKGHVRRGHWHTYRLGARKDPAGNRIDPALRKADLKWLAPQWIEGGPTEDQPHLYGVREPVTV